MCIFGASKEEVKQIANRAVNEILSHNSISASSDSLSSSHAPIHTGYAFTVATKEVPWSIQQKRLKEVMPWMNEAKATEKSQ